MSCKYVLNGKQYSEKELLKLVDASSALMSVRTRSIDETIEVLKKEAGSRFVNLDLFSPYQENIFINSITTDVLDQLGVLKPSMEIKLTPSDAFLKTLAKFEVSKKIYDYLLSRLDTDEKVQLAKSRPEYTNKFKELNYVSTVADIKERYDIFTNVIDNFEGFKQKVKINLRKYGLNVSEGDGKFQELKLDEAYFKNLVEEGMSSENVTEDERTIMETFEDGSSFMMNPRDTASTRVKLFFARIPSDKMNSLGIKEYVPYDDIVENFLEIGSELEKINFENFISELDNRSKYRPYLLEVKKQLANLKATNNIQLLQEILTFANKAYQEQTLVKWDDSVGGVKTEIIKSNRNSTILQIYNDWLEQQKNSNIVTTKNGELIIDNDKAKEFQKSIETARQSRSMDEKKAWVKQFLSEIGIEFTDQMIDELESEANSKSFAKNNLNMNFAQMFLPNNFFNILVEQYNKPSSGKSETLYEDVNNAMKDQSSSFKKLAEIYYKFTPNRYHTGSSRNGENKSIYAFINPTYLEQVKKKIKYNSGFIDKVLTRAFASTSNYLNAYNKSKKEDTNNVVLEFTYADSMKKSGKNKDAVVRKNQSEREQLFEALQKHQNEGANSGHYNLFTLSDKTTVPIINLTKYKLNDAKQNRSSKDIQFVTSPVDTTNLDDYYEIQNSLKNELYNLAESEINRIVSYSKKLKSDSTQKIQANFDKAYQYFYLFPILNKSSLDKDGARMEEIRDRMFNGEMPSDEDKTYIKSLITDVFKKQITSTIKKLIRLNLVTKVQGEDGKINLVLDKAFSAKYLAQDEILNLSNIQKLIYGVAEFKFNYIRSQVTAMQILGADPALFYKENPIVKGKNITQLTLKEKITLVKSTMDEFSKRAAMFIAPGSQGNWTWYDEKGDVVDRSSYYAVTIEDIILDTELFNGIESTDAQEYITLQEHIDRLMSEGRIPLDIWQSITDRILASKDGQITLSPREKEVVLQPTKPVHTNDFDVNNNFNRIDYVKSSTYPLIPEVIANSPLEDLAKYFHEKEIRSGNFKTAKKTGQPGEVIKLFDKEGKFVRPNDKAFDNSKQTLSREGLRTQQEIPGQKEEIRNISQANRVLFEGLLDVSDFYISNKQLSGKDLKNLKENVRINLFENSKNELLAKLGVTVDKKGNFTFKNKKALEILLKEEAIERNFSINDIESIKLGKNGEFIIPLYMMQRGEKFEGLINSLVNKVVQLKNPGTSLVQVTGVNHKFEFSDLTKKTKNEIIWLPGYDSKKGLEYLRKTQDSIDSNGNITAGKIEAAQVIVSQFITDDEGNLIDLEKFVITDPKTNRKMLDTSKFSKEMFQLVASRIPNQGLSSMLPIEVVGFLPSYMENTVVVPNGITKQMGSDFDVDKLYAYLSTMKFKYSSDINKSLIEIDKSILNIKNQLENTNTELFKNYLSSADQTEIKKLKEDKNAIISKLKWNISEKEKSRKQKIIDKIDNVIEALYENLKSINNEQYLILQQQQLLNKEKAKKEIAKLKENKRKLKTENIIGVETVSYNLDKYKGDWTSLSDLSDDQLHQLYRDIHWEVLTHPKAFEKITKSIDFDDVKNEVAELEKLGLYDSDDSYLPMDPEEQIKIFNDNRSGKAGVGIFASLGSFLADNQDKQIVIARVDENEEVVQDFIDVLDENNKVMSLTKITEAGETTVKQKDKKGNLEDSVRTKIDNNSILLSESVDNAKNKNLYRFNWAEEVMPAITAMIALSDDSNSILSIKFATRFFKQPIIEEWVSKTQVSRDSLSTYVADSRNVIIEELKDKYYKMMSEDRVLELKDPLNALKRTPTLFGQNNLLDLLKESIEIPNIQKLVDDPSLDLIEKAKLRKRLNEFAEKQIDLLDLFVRFNDLGGELTGIIGASYIYTKGIGSSVFELMSNLNKLGNLNQNKKFLNLEQLAGEVMYDEAVGRTYISSPKGEIGHSIERSLMLGEDLYRQLFPLHFSSLYFNISSLIFNGRKIDKRSVGKQRFIEINSRLFKAIRSYLYSSPSLDITDDVTEERRRLLQETKESPSLAQRIVNAKTKYPELAENYFIRRLNTNISTTEGGTSQVLYNNPFGDIDELENNKGFLSLIFSNNDELIQIAKDLALYSFITGANQTSTSFGKFIPIEYFISDEDFIKGINVLPTMLYENKDNFYKQFIQNNPDMATSLPYNIVNSLKNFEAFTIDRNDPRHEAILVDRIKTEGYGKKFADYLSFTDSESGIVFLYERDKSNSDVGNYKRINTLGTTKSGFTEYSMGDPNVVSLIFNNLTVPQRNAIKNNQPEDLSQYFINGTVPELPGDGPDIQDMENGYEGELSSGDEINYDDYDFDAPEGTEAMDAGFIFGIGTPPSPELSESDEKKDLNDRTNILKEKGVNIMLINNQYDVEDSEDGIIGEYIDTLKEAVELGEQYLVNKQTPPTESNTIAQKEGAITIDYTPVGKTKQTYTIIGDKIFNKKNEEVFKTASRDRNKIFANAAVKQGRAVVVNYRNNKYVVNERNAIISGRTGDIMKWKDDNGDKKAIIALADSLRNKVATKLTTVEDFSSYSSVKSLPVYSDSGVNVMRKNNTDQHFGNPFVGSVRPNANYDKLIKVNNDEQALSYYYNWLLGKHYTDLYPKQREWILKQIISGNLDGKKLLYYKPSRLENLDGTVIEGGYYSHADLLADLVNNKDPELYSVASQYINPGDDVSSLKENLEIQDDFVPTEPESSVENADDESELYLDQLDAPVPTDDRLAGIFGVGVTTSQYSFENDIVLNRIFNVFGKNTLSSVLNSLYKTTSNNFYKNFIKLLADAQVDIKNTVIELTDKINHPGAYINGSIKINHVLARKDNPKLSETDNIETVIMHELMHKLTQDLLKRYRTDKVTLNKNQLIFIKNIENMFNDVRTKILSNPNEGPKLLEIIEKLKDNDASLSSYEKSMYYGLTNMDEFVSMMMTDRAFQMKMNNTLYDEIKNQSVFERFKELLANLFKSLAKTLGIDLINNSVLKNSIDNIVRVITEPDIQDHSDDNDLSGDPNEPSVKPPSEDSGNKKGDPYTLLTPNGQFKANEQQIIAIDAVVEHLSKTVTTQDLFTNSFLLYGPGGTGKTACIGNATSKIQKLKNASIGYCAPSHTAKNELKRAGNKSAATFASYLGIRPKMDKYGNEEFVLIDIDEFKDKKTGELDERLLPKIFKDDIVIIDESSMIGTREIEALKLRIQERKGLLGKESPLFLFMGDYAQIPPVGEINDKDGWAINLMKEKDKSVGLIKVERTKNQDITDLGILYRRGIDYYNENLEKNINSYNTQLSPQSFLKADHTKTSANILFSSNDNQMLERYVNTLKRDPLNPRNAVYIHYNNENHKNTIEKSFKVRKDFLGSKFISGEFVVESDIIISKIPVFATKDVNTGENIEISGNQRLVVQSAIPKNKIFNVGKDFKLEVPGKNLTVNTGENIVSFFLPDYKFMLQFNDSNVAESSVNGRMTRGFLIKDGRNENVFIPFKNYYSFKSDPEFMNVEHGYIVNSHKVQGQTYNHVFVNEENIRKHVFQGNNGDYVLTPKSYAQSMYTSVSRAREKLYIVTDRIGEPKENFIEPDFKNILKSVRTDEFVRSELPNEFYLENQCKS
jgi:hypothetical protein